MNTLDYSMNGFHLTQSFEGCKLKAYQDSTGVWTIGFGHTKGVAEGQECTQDQANQWLSEDVQDSVHAVNQTVTVPLSQNQFDALVDFTFNLGAGSEAHSTLLRVLNQGDYTAAAAEFLKWNHAGGVVVAGLTKRRQAENKLFLGVAPVVVKTDNSSPDAVLSIVNQMADLVKQLQSKLASN